MYELDFVLVPIDGSDPADAALDHAAAIASDHEATVHLLYVANTNEPSLVRYDGNVIDVLEQKGEEDLSDARERVEQRGVPSSTMSCKAIRDQVGPVSTSICSDPSRSEFFELRRYPC